MIDWGEVPHGTVGTLYMPSVNAVEVMRLADRIYTRNRLTATDANSIQMEVTGGVTYVPIPAGGIGDLAGLLTLDLPPSVKRGQVLRVVLHQVVDTPPARPRPVLEAPPAPPRPAADTPSAAPTVVEAAVERRPRPARHIVGAFQFSVLVQTRAEIVPIVERVRANLKRVTSTIPPENRWSLVMKRYLSQVEGKVTALGGGDEHDRDDGVRYEGKIAGIRYDSFGDFEGFWLRTEHGDHEFSTRERDVERIVTRAWREQIAVLVIARAHARHVPASIVFLRSPRPD